MFRSPRLRLLAAAAALGGLVAVGVVATRGRETAGSSGESGGVRTATVSSPASPQNSGSASASRPAEPTGRQQAVSRAMDKTMARSLARSYVECVDRGDSSAQPRLREALVAYRDVGVEVANELIANEPHLSEAAKAALKEISAHGH